MKLGKKINNMFKQKMCCYVLLIVIFGAFAFWYYDPMGLFGPDYETGLSEGDFRFDIRYEGVNPDYLTGSIDVIVTQGNRNNTYILTNDNVNETTLKLYDFGEVVTLTIIWNFDMYAESGSFTVDQSYWTGLFGDTTRRVRMVAVP